MAPTVDDIRESSGSHRKDKSCSEISMKYSREPQARTPIQCVSKCAMLIASRCKQASSHPGEFNFSTRKCSKFPTTSDKKDDKMKRYTQ